MLLYDNLDAYVARYAERIAEYKAAPPDSIERLSIQENLEVEKLSGASSARYQYGYGPKPGDLVLQSQLHVDRIYRGGRGSPQDRAQAIFTKDSVYYRGYREQATDLKKQWAAGVAIPRLYTYYMQACFDPNIPAYVERVPFRL